MTAVTNGVHPRPRRVRSGLSLAALLFAVACGDGNGNGVMRAPPPVAGPERWAQVTADIEPKVTASYAETFGEPVRQPLSTTGTVEQLRISRDGRYLYAGYSPTDLVSWRAFVGENPDLPFCELFGTRAFLRDYAPTFGIDMVSNEFGCPAFVNIDIVVSERVSPEDAFETWQRADIAVPGRQQRGPAPLSSPVDPERLDFFVFTRDNLMLELRDTPPRPAEVGRAEPLPEPLNPFRDDFSVASPQIERLRDGRLLLLFERFVDPELRFFTFAFSEDDGLTWTLPMAMTTISPALGRIEHPHLHLDPTTAAFSLYFTLDCDIYRAPQLIADSFDSWGTPDPVMLRGNAACLADPSLTADGDLSFSVVVEDPDPPDPDDRFLADPWFSPRIGF